MASSSAARLCTSQSGAAVHNERRRGAFKVLPTGTRASHGTNSTLGSGAEESTARIPAAGPLAPPSCRPSVRFPRAIRQSQCWGRRNGGSTLVDEAGLEGGRVEHHPEHLRRLCLGPLCAGPGREEEVVRPAGRRRQDASMVPPSSASGAQWVSSVCPPCAVL